MLSEENKSLPPYRPHLKNVTALPCKMPNFLIWQKVALLSTSLCEIQPMSQQDSSKTRPYRGLILDTRAVVSLTVSKLGCTKLVFIEHGAKINGQYYRYVLLTQKLLPAIRSIAGDMFVFQQDNAPAHRARDRVEFLRRETPQFISPDMWPANSPDLNAVDYRVWGMLQELVYRVPIRDTDELRKRLFSRAWWTMQLMKHVSVQKVVILNTCYDLACLTFRYSHITTGSFQSHQCLEECNITFSRMKKFSVLQRSMVTFFRCGG